MCTYNKTATGVGAAIREFRSIWEAGIPFRHHYAQVHYGPKMLTPDSAPAMNQIIYFKGQTELFSHTRQSAKRYFSILAVPELNLDSIYCPRISTGLWGMRNAVY